MPSAVSVRRDEIEDYEPSARSWPAPGRPPLFIVRTDGFEDRERIDEALRPLPPWVLPAPGELWLDVGAGCGGFCAVASRYGAEVQPLEPDPEAADLLRKARFLNDLAGVRDPIVEPVDLEVVVEHGRRAEGIRFAIVPRLLVIPDRVQKVIGTVPRESARGLRVRLDGFEVESYDAGYSPRVRIYARRKA